MGAGEVLDLLQLSRNLILDVVTYSNDSRHLSDQFGSFRVRQETLGAEGKLQGSMHDIDRSAGINAHGSFQQNLSNNLSAIFLCL
jgi:hypothetical protein